MDIVYLDRLSIFALIALIVSRIKYSHVFYFNISPGGERVVRVLGRLGILKIPLQPVNFRVADICDASGVYQAVRIEEDTMEVCFKISDREVASNNFLKRFSRDFDFRKITLYFEKILAHEIHDMIVFVNVAKWHAHNRLDSKNESIVFFMEKDLWSRYLSQYASRSGIEAVEYPVLMQSTTLVYLAKMMKVVVAALRKKMGLLRKGVSEKNTRKDLHIPAVESGRGPLMASWYTGRSLTFDLNKRSDFFWLLKSPIPYEQVMFYFERKDVPVLQGHLDLLEEKGIKIVFLTKPATQHVSLLWHPTISCRKLEKYLLGKVVKSFFLCSIARMKRVPLFYLFRMLSFVRNYSYWYDFFHFHNIKVNINPNIFSVQHIPQSAALEKCGGVSFSYQISNFWFSSLASSSCVDVMVLFSPSYQWVWEKNRSLIGNYVSCGYITDYSFKEVRVNALQLREELVNKGVKFILCFFDENSFDDRMSIIPLEKSTQIYKYFLEKILEDTTLGLICKPGYPRTLHKRLSPIHSLIEDAKASGRCIFMDEGEYLTEKYPSEAAQASDVCVGILLGGAVALESYLSGTPTVFLDLEGLYSHPIYQWGKGKVVFYNLDELFSALNTYRTDPAGVPGFGDLSSWVKDKDLFKDGNASLRIGQYLNWLLEMFNQGLTREEAIRYANQKYAQIWGSTNISTGCVVMNPDEEKGEGYESMLNKRV